MKPLAQNTLIQNRYLIVHLIGKGGMGEVYLAVDQRLGSAVALKRTYFAGDEMLGNAFEREAKTLARMRHPVLPKVSDHFGENEEQYLVMEHISGDDLAKRLEGAQKPFPASWALFWADQLLDALSYLHSHEPPIIHRDIKPQNLKLTDENHIILLDFGLSKTSTGQTHLSRAGGSTGSIVGYTPHYAPMEQIRGIGTSARSDIYSLSATLYQLLTNTVPADALSRADSVLNDLPDPITPPCELNPEVSKNVSDVILKGMELSQDKRFATAREMQKILRKAFTEMQQAMSADTVAFTLDDDQAAAIELPFATALPQIDVLAMNEFESQQTRIPPSAEPDFDATLAFDAPLETNSYKQSGLKTEVILAGGAPLPVAEQDSAPVESFSSPEHYASNDFGTPRPEYSPDAAVPYVDLTGNGSAGESDAQAFYNGNAAGADSHGLSIPVEDAEAEGAASDPPTANRKAVVAAAGKKSGGKVFAVLGGVAALFILGTAAALGGLYYYNNYYAGQAVIEAAPSPEMSVEPSPSVEPTLETVFDSNISNTNSNTEVLASDANTNSGRDVFIDEPAPQQDTPRITPENRQKTIPARPQRTPAPKATPRPKKDGPTILQ